MLNSGFLLPVLLVLSLSAAAPETPKKVWTNDDFAAPIPMAEPTQEPQQVEEAAEQEEAPATAPTPEAVAPEPAAATAARRYVREQDVDWYRARLAPLEAELASVTGRITRIRNFLANPRDNSQAGLDLSADNMRLTPENELLLLTARQREVRQQIEQIEDEVRRNALPPGVFR